MSDTPRPGNEPAPPIGDPPPGPSIPDGDPPVDRDRPKRSVSTVVTLPEASNDTLVLVKAAVFGVRKAWRDGYRYSKAGIVTTDLVPLAASQRAFPGLGQLDREHGAALMQALDACNRRFGRGAVVPGAAGFAPKREWSTKFEMRSPPLHHEGRRDPSRAGGLAGGPTSTFRTLWIPARGTCLPAPARTRPRPSRS